MVRSSDDRRLAAAFMAEPAVFGAELRDGRLTVRVSEFAGFTRIVARVARDAGVSLFEVAPDRRLARERLRLPGDAGR